MGKNVWECVYHRVSTTWWCYLSFLMATVISIQIRSNPRQLTTMLLSHTRMTANVSVSAEVVSIVASKNRVKARLFAENT